MALLKSLQSKAAQYKEQNPEASISSFLGFAIAGIWRIILAKFYLRNCTQIGKMVSVNGKPVIGNLGTMILHDEVRVWSTIIQAKLYTGKKGKLIVGKNSRLNGVHIDAREMIQIGENVRIAPYTIILDSDFHDPKNHFSDGQSAPIIIEDNVWLATRSTILKGVRIGTGAVVATGAVVTKDVPAYTVVAGVPAKVIKQL